MTFGVLHGVQLALIAAITALAFHRLRDLGGHAGLALSGLVSEEAVSSETVDAIAAHGGHSMVAEVARASVSGEPLDLELALREQRSRLGFGLRLLRVLGAASTALGFAGALFDIAWVGQDHGVLDLDPARVARMGLESAALSMALGIGGSGLALSVGLALRNRARLLAKELDRFARLLPSPE